MKRKETSSLIPEIILDHENIEFVEFQRIYSESQVLLIRRPRVKQLKQPRELVANIWKNASDDIKRTWCIENTESEIIEDPFDMICSDTCDKTWYSSFVFKGDNEQCFNKMVGELPVGELPVVNDGDKLVHGKAVWFFIGQNRQDKISFAGRSLHTDDVPHNGTWHLQVSGSKRWFIKPTEALGTDIFPDREISITCEAGDILILNTKLWWHRTELPPGSFPSISYARDIFLGTPVVESDMTNQDGLYAATFIPSGTIIFCESDMPSCSLPRVEVSPNCEVAELEDGQMALVSARDIMEGEWFNMLESDESDA